MRLLGQIMLSFLKISPLSFGGGYAMLPVIEAEVVDRRKWMTEADMNNAISISGSAPGGIGVNAAIFVGYRLAGIRGAIAALIGISLPTFSIVLFLLGFLHYFADSSKTAAAMEGIQIAIIVMIAYAGFRMVKTAIIDLTTTVIFILTLCFLLFAIIPPIVVIPLGIAAGILMIHIKEKSRICTPNELNPVSNPTEGNATADEFREKQQRTHNYDEFFYREGI